jgi:hypothetical protein
MQHGSVASSRCGVDKSTCRHGIDVSGRRSAWMALATNTDAAGSGFSSPLASTASSQMAREHYYRAALREVFGNLDPLPSKIFRIPFLGVEPAVLPEEATVLLSQPSIAVSAAHDRIICVLAQLHSLRYCPQVPNLALILLGYLSESETFSAMEHLLRHNREQPMLLLSKRDETAFIKTFRTLVKSYYPQLSAHLEALGAPVRAIYSSWFRGFFTGWLPIEDCHRVIDAYLYEGPKVLIRYGLALLKIAKRRLKATFHGGDIDRVFRRWVARAVVRRTVAAGGPALLNIPPHLAAELSSPASADPLLPDEYSFTLLSDTAFGGISGLSRATITKLMDKYLAAASSTAAAAAPAASPAVGASSAAHSSGGAAAAASAAGVSDSKTGPRLGSPEGAVTVTHQNSLVSGAGAAVAGAAASARAESPGETSTETGVVYDRLGLEPGEDPAASVLLGTWYNPKVVGIGTRLMSADFSPCEAPALLQRMRASQGRLRRDMYTPAPASGASTTGAGSLSSPPAGGAEVHGMGALGSPTATGSSRGTGVAAEDTQGRGHRDHGHGAGGGGASGRRGSGTETGTIGRTAGWLSALRGSLGLSNDSTHALADQRLQAAQAGTSHSPPAEGDAAFAMHQLHTAGGPTLQAVAFSVASSPHLASLCTLLPPSVATLNWTCLYSTDVHGWSLDTLYSLAAGFAPVMVVLQAQVRPPGGSGHSAGAGAAAPGGSGSSGSGGGAAADATSAHGSAVDGLSLLGSTASRLATAVSSKRPVFGFYASRGLRQRGTAGAAAASSSGSSGASYGGRADFLFQIYPELNVFPVSNAEVESTPLPTTARGGGLGSPAGSTGRPASVVSATSDAAGAAAQPSYGMGLTALDLAGTGHRTTLHRDHFLSCLPEHLCVGGVAGRAGSHALRLSRDLGTAVGSQTFLSDMSVPLTAEGVHGVEGGHAAAARHTGIGGRSGPGVASAGTGAGSAGEDVQMDVLALEVYAFIDRAGHFQEAASTAADAAGAKALSHAKRLYLQRLEKFWAPPEDTPGSTARISGATSAPASDDRVP